MSLFPVFGLTGLLYGSLTAVILSLAFCALLIASLMPSGVKPEAAGKALYCAIMEGVGALLMTMGGLPAALSVLAGTALPRNSYLAMLIVFAIGGWAFLWHENMMHAIDPLSKAVPAMLLRYTFKLVGFSCVLLSLIAILIIVLFAAGPLAAGWWVGPCVLLAYGLFLSWCTHFTSSKPIAFHSAPMAPAKHATAKVPAARPAATKKRK